MKLVLSTFLSIVALQAFPQNNGEFHIDKDYPISTSGILRLSVKDARVTISASNRPTAHVKIDRVVVKKGLMFGHDEF